MKTSAAPVVTIMWTQCIVPRRENFQFMPNHFVPLCPQTKTIVPNETLDTEWPSLSNSVSSAKSVEDLQECLNDCESSDDCVPPVNLTTEQSTTSNSDKCIESINCLDSSSASSHECQMSSNSNLLQNEVVEPEVYTSTPKNTASEPSFIVHTSAISEPTESLKPGFVPCDGPFRGKLQKERFLEINEVMELFQNNNGSLSQVPAGIKENMFFLVNNSENERRKAQGKKQTFWDDCGSWTKGTSPRDLFLFQDGKLTNIVKHHGIYCTKRHSKRVPVYEPLAPQPNEEDVFVVQRAYSKHNTSLTYRRRITWIGNIPATMTLSLNPVALIEYVGLFPGRSLHGNTKHPDKNEEYIRVSDKARSIIKEKVKTQNPKNVYDELNIDAERSIHDLPRNLKQVQNFRYQEKKKERKNTHKTDNYHHNLADHVLNAESMVYTHPYVKAVTHLPSGPSVILYLDEQILDLKRFCCNKESTVLCVDKTFNLGDLFLTATVFKNTALTRRMTGEPPLFIGPAFLHGKSDFETFFHFFSHLSSLLSESEIGNMIIGTDDETAMRNGIRRAFPNATQILCTRHLKNNVLHYLKDKVGVIEKDRRRILSALFGDEGITHADDSVIAEHRVDQARQVITEVARTFIPYFEKRVLPLLLDYVVYPSNIKSIDANWTNNNAESINNILKIGTDWKPQPLTTLIETIYKKVHSQYRDSQHALIGRGNFKLTLPFIRNRVSIDVYCRMTKEERYAIFLKFLKDKGRRKERTVTASNGLITVPLTPRAGKKKLQKRGKKTERCHSKRAKFNPNKSE